MNPDGRVCFRLGGTAVELRTECDELRLAMLHIFRSFAESDGDVSLAAPPKVHGERGRRRALVNGREFRFDELDDAVLTLEDAIADQLLKDVSDCLLLHAATVSDDSMSVLVVGPSGHGKTTIALELVRRGLLYITDEYTAIEPCGTVLRPFPRSAVQKFDSCVAVGANLEVPAHTGYRSHLLPDRRAELSARPIRSCRIIFPKHDAERTPAARLLSSAESCARLMPSIFNFEGHEENLWPVMANVVSGSNACEFNYRDAKSDLDLALNLLC